MQKQLKRSIGTKKKLVEEFPSKKIRKKSTYRKTTKTIDKKFQPKIKIRNAKKVFQKLSTKEDLNNG